MILYTLYTLFAREKESAGGETPKEPNNHFARLYFDVVDNDNFRELSPMACKIYMRLLRYADWQTGKCYPSQRTLARECGCSRRTVNPKIHELVESGYIRKEKKKGNKIIYYISAYEAPLVKRTSQGVVKRSSQGCESQFTRVVKRSSHELYTVTKDKNHIQQQEHNSLSYGGLINTTGSNGEPETVESVCCRISNIFSKKFHTELPRRFVKEKINSGEVFDDQFYIHIIQTQQRMPDNPIGWWRSIDEDWVLDENARPVDSVGKGWRMYTSTVDYDPEEERRKEEEQRLRAEAFSIIEERLQEAVQNFPLREEYAEQMVQRAAEVRNIIVEEGVLDAKPYTEEEIAEIHQNHLGNYPQTDEEKRKKILFNSKGEYDVEKIMEELKEACLRLPVRRACAAARQAGMLHPD